MLLIPCLLLFFLASRDERRWFKKLEPYVAGLISLAFATPVILWNILNGQVTIRHTMGQAHLFTAFRCYGFKGFETGRIESY